MRGGLRRSLRLRGAPGLRRGGQPAAREGVRDSLRDPPNSQLMQVKSTAPFIWTAPPKPLLELPFMMRRFLKITCTGGRSRASGFGRLAAVAAWPPFQKDKEPHCNQPEGPLEGAQRQPAATNSPPPTHPP